MKQVQYDIATPYTAVYVIFRKANRIAFLLRQNTTYMNEHYSLPAGKVEKRESFTDAAVREIKEEVGVALHPSSLKQIFTGQRIHPDSAWVDIVFEATKWQGEPYNAEPHVHGELAWLDPAHLPANIVPYVRFYIDQIQAGKTYAEFGWGS
jgi:ADP-ribose pyrophosphatase YjhB (NUDIX family)